VWWRKIRQSEVLEKKKLKSSRGHLQSNTMRGEVENQAECFLKFWKKRQGLFNSHLVEFGGRENQAACFEVVGKFLTRSSADTWPKI